MAKRKQLSTAMPTDLTIQSVVLAEFAANALAAAEQLRIKTKAVEGFPLNEAEKAIAAKLPSLPGKLKKNNGPTSC